jgi:hypothetical protein
MRKESGLGVRIRQGLVTLDRADSCEVPRSVATHRLARFLSIAKSRHLRSFRARADQLELGLDRTDIQEPPRRKRWALLLKHVFQASIPVRAARGRCVGSRPPPRTEQGRPRRVLRSRRRHSAHARKVRQHLHDRRQASDAQPVDQVPPPLVHAASS